MSDQAGKKTDRREFLRRGAAGGAAATLLGAAAFDAQAAPSGKPIRIGVDHLAARARSIHPVWRANSCGSRFRFGDDGQGH